MNNDTTEKTDYQKTLNLPQTEFSMRAGLSEKEPKYLESWEKSGLYQKIRQQKFSKGKFILHDGPPYANGNIHIGHALNKILKDFIVKFKTMDGYDCDYVPGWDCHGLPIEHQLLKEMKKRKSDVDCVDFRKKAHEYAMKYVGIQRDQFKRLGVFGRWEDPYLTLTHDYEYWILNSLAELYEKGYVYHGLKPVNWCFDCETALAEAEVEYENHISPSVYVKFEVKNKELISGLPAKPLYLLVWTTTPWTLLANVAVAVHSSFQYAVADTGKDLIVVEKSLAGKVLAKAGMAESKTVCEVSGHDLTKLTYIHPFGIKTNCCVVTADYVTKEDGTGLVHTAPGHGQDDFETGKKYKLDTLMPVNDKGVYTNKAGSYEGKHVFKANKEIIDELQSKGILLVKEDVAHSYPHCWRCKNPIIFRATQQWFLKVDHNNLRGKLKDAINNNVQWIPEAGRERILSMVTSRPDWCLSRQRYWGVPIPALKNKQTGEHILNEKVIRHFAQIVKNQGTDAWFTKEVQDLIPAGFGNPDDFEKTFDILDVWFDSGVSHQAVIKGKMKEKLPVAMYLEGSDQHRGWFQSSIIPAVAIEGRPPYEAVLTHGFVVDGDGRKMSKSLGNVVSPLDIIKTSGADILRLWVASSSYNDDVRVSKEILDRLVDAYRKIRNTIRYLLSNLYDFDPDKHEVKYEDLEDLDKWALDTLKWRVNHVKQAYREYEFAKVFKSVYTFCNEELSSFYLDILKDRLYTSATNSQERRSAQTALFHTLNHLTRLITPLLSFTSEEIFSMMPKDKSMKAVESVHLLPWIDCPDCWQNSSISEKFKLLIGLRPHVMKALEDKRRDKEIGSGLEAKVVFHTASDRDYQYLKDFGGQLPDMFVVSQTEIVKEGAVDKGLDEEFSKTKIIIKKADGRKCSRSWKYSTDVGADPDHPSLSLKSAQIVKEMGYARQEDLK